jgi:amino acid transporter
VALFVKQVFHWRTVKKAREIPAALIVGLILIGVGIIYISIAIVVTL